MTVSSDDPADLVAALVASVANGGGSGQIVNICNPVEAAVLQLKLPLLPWPVWPSRQVPAGRIIAVDPNAFAFGATNMVEIDAQKEATIHMSSEPDEIVDGSGTVADPVRSYWQTDSIAFRLQVWVAFAMRGPGRVAWVDNAAFAVGAY